MQMSHTIFLPRFIRSALNGSEICFASPPASEQIINIAALEWNGSKSVALSVYEELRPSLSTEL